MASLVMTLSKVDGTEDPRIMLSLIFQHRLYKGDELLRNKGFRTCWALLLQGKLPPSIKVFRDLGQKYLKCRIHVDKKTSDQKTIFFFMPAGISTEKKAAFLGAVAARCKRK